MGATGDNTFFSNGILCRMGGRVGALGFLPNRRAQLKGSLMLGALMRVLNVFVDLVFCGNSDTHDGRRTENLGSAPFGAFGRGDAWGTAPTPHSVRGTVPAPDLAAWEEEPLPDSTWGTGPAPGLELEPPPGRAEKSGSAPFRTFAGGVRMGDGTRAILGLEGRDPRETSRQGRGPIDLTGGRNPRRPVRMGDMTRATLGFLVRKPRLLLGTWAPFVDRARGTEPTPDSTWGT